MTNLELLMLTVMAIRSGDSYKTLNDMEQAFPKTDVHTLKTLAGALLIRGYDPFTNESKQTKDQCIEAAHANGFRAFLVANGWDKVYL